ncbi:hypothetical protein CERSUDRAFT_101345 [Gelatoporia subvermispora B]|nr:hypothetical protein CERSUDRAFT_101345 [Gelatoporia subvermispora B]
MRSMGPYVTDEDPDKTADISIGKAQGQTAKPPYHAHPASADDRQLVSGCPGCAVSAVAKAWPAKALRPPAHELCNAPTLLNCMRYYITSQEPRGSDALNVVITAPISRTCGTDQYTASGDTHIEVEGTRSLSR